MKRRSFIRSFAAGGSILFAAPVVINGCTKDEINNTAAGSWDLVVDLSLADFGTLKEIGGYAYSGNMIIIRTSISQYQALSKLCTHQSCILTYNHAEGKLVCPCHSSKFNIDGTVDSGPATKALKRYAVQVKG